MEKARFYTKIVIDGEEDLTKYNNQIVEIIEYQKGRYVYNDRYTIKFKNGKIAKNIMSCELDFII